MGLMVMVTVTSLAYFMLFVLVFWIQEAKGKPRTRKTNNKPPRMRPFLAERENGNQTSDVAMFQRKGTHEVRLSKKAAAPPEVSQSERLVRQRIVQIFAARMAPRSEE